MFFWKWWTFFVLSIVSLWYVQYELDVYTFILENDPTYITIVVSIIFFLSTLVVGTLSYQKQFSQKEPKPKTLENLWFTADAVMSLGMVGTLLGFLMVLTSTFQDVDTSSTEAMKEVIGQLAAGMGTALLTSLAGLISSILLKTQLMILDTEDEKV